MDQLLTDVGRQRVFCWLHYFDPHDDHLDKNVPLHRLARRHPSPRRLILLGYGQNAMRLIAAAHLLGFWDNWDWQAWDDDPRVQAQAEHAGLATSNPWHNPKHDPTAPLIVTPRGGAYLETRPGRSGYPEGTHWLRLC
ncbi:MAG: hypothetical protein KA354_18515 [Phycisphaerae bacterium]|nr:hypothetical protein [Phycisphaerae bacterium]